MNAQVVYLTAWTHTTQLHSRHDHTPAACCPTSTACFRALHGLGGHPAAGCRVWVRLGGHLGNVFDEVVSAYVLPGARPFHHVRRAMRTACWPRTAAACAPPPCIVTHPRKHPITYCMQLALAVACACGAHNQLVAAVSAPQVSELAILLITLALTKAPSIAGSGPGGTYAASRAGAPQPTRTASDNIGSPDRLPQVRAPSASIATCCCCRVHAAPFHSGWPHACRPINYVHAHCSQHAWLH